MAVIYLKHPQHGAKVACSDMEAVFDEQNGWERYDPNDPTPQEAPPANTLRVRRSRLQTAETQS